MCVSVGVLHTLTVSMPSSVVTVNVLADLMGSASCRTSNCIDHRMEQ